MTLWDKLKGRSAAKDEDREQQQLDAEHRGETTDLRSHKREVREQHSKEGFPSAGGGYIPPP
jgi:hypothetical protein